MKTLSVLSLAAFLALGSNAFAQEQTNPSANSQAQATQNTTQEKEKTEWEKTAEDLDKQLEEGKKMGFW